MDMANAPTCGALYHELVTRLFPDGAVADVLEGAPDIAYACFAMGFMAGQAEKVYNGACAAFLIRPAPDWWEWSYAAMVVVTAQYELDLLADTTRGELWGYALPVADDVYRLTQPGSPDVVNTPSWHAERARLCGIPVERYDRLYHERRGAGCRCEPA